MRLDAAGAANAIAASTSFAAGLLAPLNAGTMERPFQQAHNTLAGVMAAFLAASGLAAHTGVVEGAGSFYTTFMGEDAFPSDANDGLGETWYITESFSKPYPSAGSNTVGIAVLDHLLQQGAVAGDNIVAMRVEVVPRFTGKPGYPAIANPGPFETIEHALISFPFGLACLARFSAVTLETLTEALGSTQVAELARSIDLVGIDPPYPLWCRITVTDRAGRAATATADEIEWRHFHLDERTATEKFLAASTLPPDRSHEFVSRVLDLASAPSVRRLTAPLVDVPVPSNAGSTS
jgi:2-methylcitrate dehydratase PrpD